MRGLRRARTPLVVLVSLVLGGCGRGGDDGGGQSGPAQTTPGKSAPSRPLAARWYQDADGNGVPDFVEQRLGYDPASDECLNKAGCDRALVDEGLRLLEKPNNTMLLLDSSGSMAAPAGGGQSKITVAKQAITQYVEALPGAFRLGFEVFGHRGSGRKSGKAASCRGAEILARPGELKAESVGEVLDRFEPRGFTPLAAALRRGGSAFTGPEKANNRVILVTDGVETCGRHPVAAARALKASGVAVTVDVVGFDVGSADAAKLREIAEASGGTYTDARSGKALQDYFAAQEKRIEQIRAAIECLYRSDEAESDCQLAQRDNAVKFMLRARDEESNANADTRGEVYVAISKIIERANTGQTTGIRVRRQRNRSKIREFLRELSGNAAFHPDDSCGELQRALAHGPPPGTRLA